MLVGDRFEEEYGGLFDNYGVGCTIWSPMAGGMLSGKYIEEVPKDSRVSSNAMAKSLSYVFKRF